MGKKKDKKKKKQEIQDEKEDIIDIEEDKQLFEDIFGVSIDDIKDEDEDEKYEDILEDLDEIREVTVVNKQPEVNLIEPIEVSEIKDLVEDPVINDAVQILQQKIVMKPIAPPRNFDTKINVGEKSISKKIISPPPKIKPKIQIVQPPKVRKITEFPIKIIQSNVSHLSETSQIEPKKTEIPPIKKIAHDSGTPGVIKPISFQNTTVEELPSKPVKVTEPQAAFKTAKLFIDDTEIAEKNENEEELSDIRCGTCGTRITKKAEISLKEGWIINCKACGNQIIHH